MNRTLLNSRWARWSLVAALALTLIQALTPAHAQPGNDPREPDLTPAPTLAVPEGNKVSFHAYAEGVQIYRWTGVAWQLQRPEAWLYANADMTGVVGTHYVGPTWESNSGSKVKGVAEEKITVDPTAIQWLRLRAVAWEGPGPFAKVTYIQRVNTEGGLAPSEPGDFIGDEARIPYTAEYFFYRAK